MAEMRRAFLVMTAESAGPKYGFEEIRAAVCYTLERAMDEIATEVEPEWRPITPGDDDGVYAEMPGCTPSIIWIMPVTIVEE
jgi:hypothetical protein